MKINPLINYRQYSVFLIVVFFTVSTPVLTLNLYHQPLIGDLTRIGYFSENDYGWQESQLLFSPGLAVYAKLDEDYDIIIIGDSYSYKLDVSKTPEGAYWTHALANKTGLKVGVYHVSHYPTMELVSKLVSKDNPPKLIIYQSVERDLKARLGKDKVCPSETVVSEIPPIEVNELGSEAEKFYRDVHGNQIDFGYTVKYIYSKITSGIAKNRVREVKLNRRGLFTNKHSERLLYLNDDNKKKNWTKQDWNNIACNALEIQNSVRKNSSTEFLFLVSPDKSTIYHQFLEDSIPSGSRMYLLKHPQLNFLRLDDKLKDKVVSGKKDVYLPNDSHWSSITGHWVADQVILYLGASNNN